MNFLRNTFVSFVLSAIILNSGCEELLNADDDCEVAPFDCIDSRPTEGQLIIRSTINAQNPQVPVWVYLGDFENNDLVMDTMLSVNGLTLILPVDHYYSVVAKYIQADGDTVFAVDGDDIEVDEEDYCDATCFSLDNGHIDVRLKFPKQ
ncbi:hypothetical protein K1X84_05660 [bacterium]|nr:hypothetical protein [bacterium]